MDALLRWLTLLTAMAAALAALIYLARITWRVFHKLDQLNKLVEHELTPNSGTSMKDDVLAIAHSVGQVQADVAQLQADVADLSQAKAVAHELLQAQLDALVGQLGHHGRHASRHRREEDK